MIGMETVSASIALVLTLAAASASLGAAFARTLYGVAIFVAVAGACAAAAVLANGEHAAVTFSTFAVGWAPVVLLGVIALTSRAVKSPVRRTPWASIAGAALVVGALGWAGWTIGGEATSPQDVAAQHPAWIAALTFVAALGCIGLLGFGERGALERRKTERSR